MKKKKGSMSLAMAAVMGLLGFPMEDTEGNIRFNHTKTLPPTSKFGLGDQECLDKAAERRKVRAEKRRQQAMRSAIGAKTVRA